MDKNSHCIADKIWDDLVRACQELGLVPAQGAGSYPQYNRLVFNQKYHLLTFEVGRGHLPNFPNDPTAATAAEGCLVKHFNHSQLDIVDLGPKLYFNFWINSIRQD